VAVGDEGAHLKLFSQLKCASVGFLGSGQIPGLLPGLNP
jgi:hypothetical protein